MSTTRPASHGSSRLPLVVGVTGHRDLRVQDVPALENAVRGVFTQLTALCPNTPFAVLSALAEGADRLVARVALEFGARLVAPLPLPRKLYAADFPATVPEFEALLARAECFELPTFGGYDLAQIESPGPARDEQYAQVGAYIVRRCQLLIALWDGIDSGLTGGTAEVVRWKLEGVPEKHLPPQVYSRLGGSEQGPVYHVMTPRKKNPDVDPPFAVIELHPEAVALEDRAAAPREHRLRLDLLDQFNRDTQELAPSLAAEIGQNAEYLYPLAEVPGLPRALQQLRDDYGVADTLALRDQSRTYRTLLGLHWLAFAALLFFELHAHVLPGNPWWCLLFYPGFLLAATLWHGRAQRRAYESKYLDYRALAEGLRVEFFWRLAGLDDSVPDHYLRIQRSELRWIPDAIRGLEAVLDRPAATDRAPSARARLAEVNAHWVENQREFFERKAPQNRNQKEKFEFWSRTCFWLSMGAAVFLLVANSVRDHFAPHELLALVPMALVPAALLRNYADKRAFSAHARQYSLMSELFGKAKKRLLPLAVEQPAPEPIQAATLAAGQAILRELGREALVENGEWLLLHRERPLAVPDP